MPKKLNYQLSAKDLEIVEQAIRREKDPRVVKRATGIRLLHQGYSPQAVAEMLLNRGNRLQLAPPLASGRAGRVAGQTTKRATPVVDENTHPFYKWVDSKNLFGRIGAPAATTKYLTRLMPLSFSPRLASKPTARGSEAAIWRGWLVNSLLEIVDRQAARR